MDYFYLKLVVLVFAFLDVSAEDISAGTSTTPPSSSQPQPVYQPGYVPHATYPYVESYGPVYPGYPFPASPYAMSAVIPAAQGAFQTALKIFTKVGLFLIGGLALLLVGGIFTTAVCSFTSICTINFAGWGGIDKETMRAYMTPEKISTAAALVQDAIGKYQRLQRAVNN
ncbi:hypothetical protein MTP99_005360 [Tenebrio molitor]|nr:hypothetical protein MTP99_005360 [Tenebrio molitor]